jgi:CO dehydrogenase maturation factor
MTRGTVCTVDAVLLVTEPYYRSLETTGRLAPLARELGVPQVWAVANKLRSPRDEAAVREYSTRHELQVLGAVPFDERVTEADNQGLALLDYAPDSAAVREIRRLGELVAERLQTVARQRDGGLASLSLAPAQWREA